MASAWLLGETGRKVAGIAGLTGAAIGALAGLLPHSHLLNVYKDIVRAYKDGMPMNLDPVVEERAHQVLQSVDISTQQKENVHFFPVPMLDTFFAGSTTGVKGAIIGLPVTFSYAKKEDVQTKSLLIHGTKEPAWETREGDMLKSSLVLSDKAQRFVIARDIYWASTYYVEIQSGALSFSVLNCYLIARLANEKLPLLTRVPRALRLVWYGIIVAFNATMYIGFKDGMSQYWDKKADRRAAALGSNYVEGGIEYYEKILQRNRALRELLGSEGERCYTSKGNVNRLLRTDHVPITHRLDGLRSLLHAGVDSESQFIV
uniref:Putative conserved plasma membrane protein n=1 Tax=Amblyomma parvum TaxID=251391 RepID=A0A023FWE8_AMBPA